MKSYLIHLKNKYPGAHINYSENGIDVFTDEGHAISMVKNGAGQFVCRSEEMGCYDKFDLAPIPKESRVFKEVDGKIALDEKSAERIKARSEFMCDKGIKVLSCHDLKQKGYEFDDKQRVYKKPESKSSNAQA